MSCVSLQKQVKSVVAGGPPDRKNGGFLVLFDILPAHCTTYLRLLVT